MAPDAALSLNCFDDGEAGVVDMAQLVLAFFEAQLARLEAWTTKITVMHSRLHSNGTHSLCWNYSWFMASPFHCAADK